MFKLKIYKQFDPSVNLRHDNSLNWSAYPENSYNICVYAFLNSLSEVYRKHLDNYLKRRG